jgi:membrane protease YdiL (CAAX protease family)
MGVPLRLDQPPGVDVFDWPEIVCVSVAWAVVAVLGLLVLAAWWGLVPAARAERLPMRRIRRISWAGIDVLAAFFLFEALTALVFMTFQTAGLFDLLYPQDNKALLRGAAEFWTGTFAPPLIMGLIVLGLHQIRGTRPVEMGLTRARAGVNVRLGYLVWLLVTPVTYALLLASVELIQLGGGTPDQHPIEIAGRQALGPVEWLLMFVSALMTVPLLEELLFRGLLLPWQLRGGWESQATVAFCALFVGALWGVRENGYNPGTLCFVLAVLPALWVLPYWQLRHALPETPVAEEAEQHSDKPGWVLTQFRYAADVRAQPTLAICINGLLFAAMHGQVWPSPVALFPLGMALAWLRYRTSSLVGAVTLHVLFNAVGMLAILC